MAENVIKSSEFFYCYVYFFMYLLEQRQHRACLSQTEDKLDVWKEPIYLIHSFMCSLMFIYMHTSLNCIFIFYCVQ